MTKDPNGVSYDWGKSLLQRKDELQDLQQGVHLTSSRISRKANMARVKCAKGERTVDDDGK